MGTIQTLLQVKADASQAVSGLKPLQASLAETATSAQTTEASLNTLSSGAHAVSLNDEAIKNAQAEIARLRTEMRQQLTTDVNADTRPAQARIRQLQSSIKTLGQEPVDVEVNVEENVSGDISGGALRGLASSLAQGATSAIPLPGILSKIGTVAGPAAAGLEGVGGAAAGLGSAATVGGPLAIGGAVVIMGAKIGIGLGSAAADVETLQVSLDSLTGGKGAETLAFLQKWAAATPFTLAEGVKAFQLLASAGVPLKDIPDDLNKIGDIASSMDPRMFDSITLPLTQMISSGKASYENIQQLVELAGVPAWSLLAKNLGLTVAETQKLASEGKLGKESIQLLIDALGKKSSGAMAAQAATFNGQLSSLQDNLTQVKQNLGAIFLPAMEDALGIFNDLVGPILDGASALKVFNDQLREKSGGFGLLEVLNPAVGALHLVKSGLDLVHGSGDSAAKSQGSLADQAKKARDELDAATNAATDYDAQLKSLTDTVSTTVDALGNIGENVRIRISFIISQADAKEAVDKAIKGDKDNKGIRLPAHLDINQIGGLGDKQQQLISDISDFVSAGLSEGARRVKLNPDFDVEGFDLKVRQQARALVIKAGVDPKDANRVLDNIIGIPRKAIIRTSADNSGANRDLNNFLGTPHKVKITPFVDQKTAQQAKNSIFQQVIRGPGGGDGQAAPIKPTVNAGAVNTATATLNSVAQPGGKPRDAKVRVAIDGGSLAAARGTLASLTATETKIIKVHMQENPTGQSLDPNTVGAILGNTRTQRVTVVPGGGQTTEVPRTVQLEPRRTPVQVSVLLDGKEIASHLDLQAPRLAATGVRRA